MRLDLKGIDSRALSLDLSSADAPGDARYVHLHEAYGLSGVLEQSLRGFQLSNVEAERAVLDGLRLMFGRVLVELLGRSEASQLATELMLTDFMEMGLKLAKLSAPTLRVCVGDTVVEGRARLADAELSVHAGGGHVEATTAALAGLKLQMDGLRVSIDELHATPLRVGWGEAGFSLRAATVVARGVTVSGPGFELAAETLELAEFKVHRGEVFLSGCHLGEATVDVQLPEAPPAEEQPGVVPSTDADEAHTEARSASRVATQPWVDWRLLDRLHGQVHVDVGIDASLPVIGRRRAVHELRLDVQEGRVDFRALESDLSALEDALLDFSVREDALVLELGIPLLPTRGMGKPLIRWPLDAQEMALAQSQRLVRLATLARPTGSSTPVSPERSSSKSSVQLRALTLRNVSADLHLVAEDTIYNAWVRALELQALRMSGEVVYCAEPTLQTEDTVLTAEGQALEITVNPLPMGARVLSLSPLSIAELRILQVHLRGVRPRQIKAQLSKLSVQQLSLAES